MEQRKELTGRLFAIDASSKREFDANGYLHVADNRLTCDQVAGYYGFELPDGDGIERDRIYYAYRPAEELQKALDTYNGVPLLIRHEFDSPDEPLKHLRVGAVGTDARWEEPFVVNSLTVWDKDAIEKIQDGSLADLSCGYTFTPEWKAGTTADGVNYDFVMRDIQCNHVALVEKGRATGCRVADNLPISTEDSSMEENVKKACDDGFEKAVRGAIESAELNLSAEKADALVQALIAAHNEYEAAKAESAEDEKPCAEQDEDAPEQKDEDKPESEPEPEKEQDEDKAEEGAKAGDSDLVKAIDAAVAKAVDAERERVKALFSAAEEIRATAGAIRALDFETPAAIYQVGLKALGIEGISDMAAPEVFRAVSGLKKTAPITNPEQTRADALSARISNL